MSRWCTGVAVALGVVLGVVLAIAGALWLLYNALEHLQTH